VIESAINSLYLTQQRPRISDLMREIKVECRDKALKPPDYRTVKRRINALGDVRFFVGNDGSPRLV